MGINETVKQASRSTWGEGRSGKAGQEGGLGSEFAVKYVTQPAPSGRHRSTPNSMHVNRRHSRRCSPARARNQILPRCARYLQGAGSGEMGALETKRLDDGRTAGTC